MILRLGAQDRHRVGLQISEVRSAAAILARKATAPSPD
jgi:hypothetical protein